MSDINSRTVFFCPACDEETDDGELCEDCIATDHLVPCEDCLRTGKERDEE